MMHILKTTYSFCDDEDESIYIYHYCNILLHHFVTKVIRSHHELPNFINQYITLRNVKKKQWENHLMNFKDPKSNCILT